MGMEQRQAGCDPFPPPTPRTIQNGKKDPAKAEEMQAGVEKACNAWSGVFWREKKSFRVVV